jgi:hypothetical protein
MSQENAEARVVSSAEGSTSSKHAEDKFIGAKKVRGIEVSD